MSRIIRVQPRHRAASTRPGRASRATAGSSSARRRASRSSSRRASSGWPHAERRIRGRFRGTLERLGIPVERLSAGRGRPARWPISPDGLAFVALRARGRRAACPGRGPAAARRFERRGGRLRDSVGPAPRHRSAGASGRRAMPVAASGVVFAAGPWLPRLFPDVVGPRDPRHPAGRPVLSARPPAIPTFDAAAFPAWIDYDDAFYGIPALDGRGAKARARSLRPGDRSRPRWSASSIRTPSRRAELPRPAIPAPRRRADRRDPRLPVRDRPPTPTSSSIAIPTLTTSGSSAADRATASSTGRESGATSSIASMAWWTRELDERFSITRVRPPSRGMRSAVPA